MSAVNVINAVKTITVPVQLMEMYSISFGGEQGEETKLFLTWEDAWNALWESVLDNWEDDLIGIFHNNKKKLDELKEIIRYYFTFPSCTTDGTQRYLFNGSSYLPKAITDKYVRASWWWMTKHVIEIPDNLKVK